MANHNLTLDELKLVAKYRILDSYQNLLLNLKYLWIYGQAWEEKMVKKNTIIGNAWIKSAVG